MLLQFPFIINSISSMFSNFKMWIKYLNPQSLTTILPHKQPGVWLQVFYQCRLQEMVNVSASATEILDSFMIWILCLWRFWLSMLLFVSLFVCCLVLAFVLSCFDIQIWYRSIHQRLFAAFQIECWVLTPGCSDLLEWFLVKILSAWLLDSSGYYCVFLGLLWLFTS